MFIDLLQTYIADKNNEAEQSRQDVNNQSQTTIHLNLTVDHENDNQIQNPLIRRPKGRPVWTARFKGPLEASTNLILFVVKLKTSVVYVVTWVTIVLHVHQILIERKENFNLSPAPFGRRNVLKIAKYHLIYLFVVIIYCNFLCKLILERMHRKKRKCTVNFY